MTGPVLDPNYDPRSDGAMREGGHKLVKPRHAATLIIVRRDAKKPRLLMGRRNRGQVWQRARVQRGAAPRRLQGCSKSHWRSQR